VTKPVREITKSPQNAYKYTGKGNLVAVITDGSATLGLGKVAAAVDSDVKEQPDHYPLNSVQACQ